MLIARLTERTSLPGLRGGLQPVDATRPPRRRMCDRCGSGAGQRDGRHGGDGRASGWRSIEASTAPLIDYYDAADCSSSYDGVGTIPEVADARSRGVSGRRVREGR